MRSIEHRVVDATVDLVDATVDLVNAMVDHVAAMIVDKTLVTHKVIFDDRFLVDIDRFLIAKDYQFLKDKFQKKAETK